MRADMTPHRAPALAAWLAALFVAVVGLLAPAPAAAHGGHDHAAPAGGIAATDAVLAPLAVDADQVAAGAPAPCAGAVCCSAGHGCCAALAGAVALPALLPRAPPPAPVLAGLPAGLGAATLPEPPRPFR
jgi:hypothetical protein